MIFHSYITLDKYLKLHTNKEYFICSSTKAAITVVIARQDKLITKSYTGYMSGFEEKQAKEFLQFVNQE